MKSQVLGLRVAGSVFALVSLGQLFRLLTRANVLIDGLQLPFWPSGVACVVAAFLSWWLWRLSFPRAGTS